MTLLLLVDATRAHPGIWSVWEECWFVDRLAEICWNLVVLDPTDALAAAPPPTVSTLPQALGPPAALFTAADNQVDIAAAPSERGAAVFSGWHDDVAAALIVEAYYELDTNCHTRHEMDQAASRLWVGQDASRVAEELYA